MSLAHSPDSGRGEPVLLYVEDDVDVRATIADALAEAGFQVEVADNGARALEKLDRGLRPNAVLTDLMMPVMSGWELVTRIRCSAGLQHLPIAVMSIVTERSPRHVDAVLGKPTDVRTLVDVLGRLCAGRR